MSSSHDLARIALFSALISVLGLLPQLLVPYVGVPITLQTLGVMLAGVILGPKHGFLSVLLFVFVVLMGAPFLSGGRGGLGVLETPSVGFIIGFPIAAFAVGLAMKCLDRIAVFWASLISSIIGGIIVLYVPGIIGLAFKTDGSIVNAATICIVYVPGDVIKAILTAFIARAIHRALPSAIKS